MPDYIIRSRYLVAGEGWKVETVAVTAPAINQAWDEASYRAHALDEKYGSDHFWTVDLQTPEGSSYVQLFHGRLS